MRETGQHRARRRIVVAGLAAALIAPAAATGTVAAGPDGGEVSGAPAGTRVTLQGTVRVVIADDFERGRSDTQYTLETDAGRVDLVVPDGRIPDLAGREAVVSGTVLPGGAVRIEDTQPVDAAGVPARDGGDVAAHALVADPGGAADAVYGWSGPAVRRVAVVIASYTDLPDVNGTIEDVTEAMTGDGASVRTFFETASRGRVTIQATVIGPWSLPIDSCPEHLSFGDTVNAVVARSEAEGVNLARFDHVLMWTPAPCFSGWTARGEVPGSFVHMSAPYPDSGGRLDEFVNVAAHELGHNMGLLHANSLLCEDDDDPVALADDCDTVAYGDPFSTMGGDQGFYDGLPPDPHWVSPLYDSAELAHLGWLDPDEEQVVTGPGSYDLVSTYAAGDGVRLLRIRRPSAPADVDPSMGYPLRHGWLTVELRNDPPAGPFDTLVPGSPSTEGVIVRYVEDGYDPFGFGYLPASGSTYIVDTVPGTRATEMWHPQIHDAPLTEDETLTDPVTGTTITLTSIDGDSATVAVAFPGGNPPAAPVIGAPRDVEADAADGRATVSWRAPATNDDTPVGGYTVRSYPGGHVCHWIPGFAPPARTCTVTGLANGTTYRFTVTASTDGGDWQMSLPSNAVTPTGPPKAHVVPLATYRRAQAIDVRWTGDDDGQPVDSQDVRYRQAPWNGGFGSPTTWKAATTATTGSLTGGTGRTYCFSARSRNNGVTGPWSDEACTAVPLDDRSLKASNAWNEVSGAALYRQTGLRTTSRGATLKKANVEARRIALVASTSSSSGTIEVYWNGTLEATVRLKTSGSKDRVVLPLLSFPKVRTGDLKLVVKTSGKRVQVDGLAVSRS